LLDRLQLLAQSGHIFARVHPEAHELRPHIRSPLPCWPSCATAPANIADDHSTAVPPLATPEVSIGHTAA
jgi:hypothetical protein